MWQAGCCSGEWMLFMQSQEDPLFILCQAVCHSQLCFNALWNTASNNSAPEEQACSLAEAWWLLFIRNKMVLIIYGVSKRWHFWQKVYSLTWKEERRKLASKTNCHSLQPVRIPCNLWNTSNQKIAKCKGKQLSKTKVKLWQCQTIPHLGKRQNRENCVCSGADTTAGTEHGARTWGLLVCSSLWPAARGSSRPQNPGSYHHGEQVVIINHWYSL